jgi:lipopolysaccharide assembly outer membrane protein LptD (OstA)
MIMKQAVLLVLVLGCTPLLGAQAPVIDGDVVRLSGGVSLSTAENVQLTAESAELNQRTGEMLLFGTVILRQATQQIAGTNKAGAPFPEPGRVMMRFSGNFQVSIGDLTVRADEADLNGLTGELTLRGDVRASNSNWAGKQWFK